MADDDQQAPQQRYWFPYWTNPPVPAPRPAIRPQPSRRDTRPAQPQAAQAAASRGAGGAGSPQPTRLSSRPSPSHAHPLAPIGEPNSRSAPAPAPASVPKETKPSVVKHATPVQPASHEKVMKELDIVVPQEEKIIHEPPSDTKAQSKAVEKEKEGDKEKKDKEKKHKEGKEKEEKEKEKDNKEKKEKDHKEKKEKEHKDEKHKEEKEKDHKKKKDKDDKHKGEHDESKVHGGKLHKELKAGVADMVHKLGATAAPSAAGHERHGHAPAAGPGTTIITLAGENKGASMKASHADADSKDAAGKERRAARKLDEGNQEAYGGAKGVTAFVNSNVQVVNNSFVFQSSCSSSDPGVHLKLSTKSKKKDHDQEAGGKGAAAAKKI